MYKNVTSCYYLHGELQKLGMKVHEEDHLNEAAYECTQINKFKKSIKVMMLAGNFCSCGKSAQLMLC